MSILSKALESWRKATAIKAGPAAETDMNSKQQLQLNR